MDLIFKTIKETWKYLLLLMLFVLISTALLSYFPKYTQILLDGKYNFEKILILFTIGIASVLTNYTSSVISLKISNRIYLYFNSTIMCNLVRAKFDFYNKKDKGVILTRISSDVHEFNSFFLSLIGGFVRNILSILIIIPIMISMSPIISAIVTMIIISMVIINLKYSKKIKTFSMDIKNNRDKLGSLKLRYILNIENIKTNCLEDKVLEDYKHNLNLSINSIKRLFLLQTGLTNISQVLSIILLCVIYGVGFYMINNNSLTLGEMIAFSMYGNMIYQPISSLMSLRNSWYSVIPSIDRIREYLELKKERYTGHEIDHIEDLKFINVHKSFNDTLLKYDFNFDEKLKYAIIGENGSGKTTLFRLLLGLYSIDSGQMKINDFEIDVLNISQFRSRVSYLSQSSPLMQGSVKEVIGVNQYSIDKFHHYVDLFMLNNILLNDEDTILSENISLSGGEQQSLKIIKVFLSDCDIILLDEPTNNLDNERKSVFIETLQETDKTILIITHDNDVISVCDKVYNIG